MNKRFTAILKILLFIFLIFLVLVFSLKFKKKSIPKNLNSPYEYVFYAVDLIKKNAILKVYRKEFKEKAKTALKQAKNLENLNRAKAIVKNLAKSTAGENANLIEKKDVEEIKNKTKQMPTFKMVEENILYLKLPPISTMYNVVVKEYYEGVLNFVNLNKNKIKSVLIDLKDNYGGDISYMLCAVSPFLENTVVLEYKKNKFSLKKGYIEISEFEEKKEDYIPYYNIYFKRVKLNPNIPIAILQNSKTASEAEHVVLMFKGKKNVKTFGEKTKGLNTMTCFFSLGNDKLILPCYQAKSVITNEFFKDEPINPDVVSKNSDLDAINWLKEKINKN